MVETRLVRPGNRVVEAWCPGCRHLRRIHSNARRGVAHCIYCGADFEWEESVTGESGSPVRNRTDWFSGLADTAILSR